MTRAILILSNFWLWLQSRQLRGIINYSSFEVIPICPYDWVCKRIDLIQTLNNVFIDKLENVEEIDTDTLDDEGSG